VVETKETTVTRIDRMVRDLALVTNFALEFPYVNVDREARLVRATVDENALINVIDALVRRAERHGLTWERERAVLAACERLDRDVGRIRKHQEEIRRRLSAA
jgi:hypothetical protein